MRSEKRVPRIAFAGCLETLSSQESASGAKMQLSERSEFCIFAPAFRSFLQAESFCIRNPQFGEPFSQSASSGSLPSPRADLSDPNQVESKT